MNRTYTERAKVLKKNFDVIDKAIETDNVNMLQISIGAVVNILENSPIADFQKLTALYKDTKQVIDI